MPKTHKHNLSHYRLMSGRFGELLPVSVMETLPGDMFRIQTTALLRLSPMVAPVMHPIHIRLHAFFVPNRIIWDEWENFIVDMNTNLTVPQKPGQVDAGSNLDYMGIPPGNYDDNPINGMPMRAYNAIYNEYFRDQDLDPEVVFNSTDIQRVRWGKDYFTTARTEAQRGATETVQIEFDQDVPLHGLGLSQNRPAPLTDQTVDETGNPGTLYGEAWNSNVTDNEIYIEGDGSGNPNVRIPGGFAAGSMDINEWRRAMAFQRLSEHRNKYGSRYTDYMRFLGVKSSDARLQRPEYIGGGSAAIQISEVLSTSDTVTDVQTGSELGTLAGHGVAGHRTKPLRYFCEEHGHIMVLASVRPKTMYMEAVHRNWYRKKPEDYWQKETEIMGDQPVTVGEIRANADAPNTIFGYVDRHRDYREQFSGVSGEMRDLLNYWHLARDFSSDPQLNSSFVECNPTERIFADTNTDTFQLMASHRVAARRLVSKRARI